MNIPSSDTDQVAQKSPEPTYNPNPILLVVSGIERLFKYAKPFAIALLVLSILVAISNWTTTATQPANEPEDTYSTMPIADPSFSGVDIATVAIVGLIGLVLLAGFITLAILINGLVDYSAAAAAKGRNVTIKETFSGVFAEFWPYLKLRLLVFVKILLWSLLFILPGIYFTYRYCLAGVVFFAENKKGSEAIKESMKLTDGAWLTTFASYGFFNLITLGILQPLADTGTTAELYNNYRSAADKPNGHPDTHWLSWLFVVGLIALAALLVIGLIALIAVLDGATGGSSGGAPVWRT